MSDLNSIANFRVSIEEYRSFHKAMTKNHASMSEFVRTAVDKFCGQVEAFPSYRYQLLISQERKCSRIINTRVTQTDLERLKRIAQAKKFPCYSQYLRAACNFYADQLKGIQRVVIYVEIGKEDEHF